MSSVELALLEDGPLPDIGANDDHVERAVSGWRRSDMVGLGDELFERPVHIRAVWPTIGADARQIVVDVR